MFGIELSGLLQGLLFILRKWAPVVLDELRCGLALQRLNRFRQHGPSPYTSWLMVQAYAYLGVDYCNVGGIC